MSDDDLGQLVEAAAPEPTPAPVEPPKPPAPKGAHRVPPERRRGRNSPPETMTLERRLELTRQAARRLAKQAKTRLPLRLAVSLELHEALVAVAEKIGAAKVPDVAVRAMEIGIASWASSIKVRADGLEPLSVFERTPAAGRAHREYGGVNEQRVRDEIAEQAEETRRHREAEAERLHIPGRRRAAAS